MEKNIAVIRGDGIGPEVIDAAITVLETAAGKFYHRFNYNFVLAGGAGVDATGVPLPAETLEACKAADAVFSGPVGGPAWDSLAAHLRPEKGLLSLRSSLGLFANIRPAVLYGEIAGSSPLRPDIAKKGIDLVVVRELTGGIFFGPRGFRDGPFGQEAFDTEVYSIYEIERIAKLAFEIASARRSKVTSVDKANILDSGKLWRATVAKVAKQYPAVTLENMLVDTCAAQLIKDPSQFDVLLCPSMFGDILSDVAAMVTGSVGLLPSSSIGAGKFGLYEPVHGSAPDIAGTDTANPIAAILSAGMMLSSSFDLHAETQCIEHAVKAVLAKGYRTPDLAGPGGGKKVGCAAMAELIAMQILSNR